MSKSEISHTEKEYVNSSFAEKWRPLIALIFSIILGAFLLFSDTAWKDINPVFEETLGALACFFAGVGAFGRVWCSLYIEGKKNNKLVTDGPYSLCRNPLYFFSSIGAVGVSLFTETLTIPLIVAIAFAVQYPFVVKREQKRLENIFGEEYEEYKRRVPVFLPRTFRVPKQSESYEINLRKVYSRIIDALWFIWVIGILEFIGGFQKAGILPIWFNLY